MKKKIIVGDTGPQISASGKPAESLDAVAKLCGQSRSFLPLKVPNAYDQ